MKMNFNYKLNDEIETKEGFSVVIEWFFDKQCIFCIAKMSNMNLRCCIFRGGVAGGGGRGTLLNLINQVHLVGTSNWMTQYGQTMLSSAVAGASAVRKSYMMYPAR